MKPAPCGISHARGTVPGPVVENDDIADKPLHGRGDETRKGLDQFGLVVTAFHNNCQHESDLAHRSIVFHTPFPKFVLALFSFSE